MENDTQKYLETIARVIAEGKYKDTWESLAEHPVPKWFLDGKFGIFIHWGVYSVPAFGSEWYSRNMYIKDSPEYKHHLETYGEHKKFGYKDFIPMFQGEKFNADEWMELFSAAGAKYVVPVAEHHDGFQMYRSEISHWNAYEMGPKRDVLGELSNAAKKLGIVGGASTHRIEHWFFMSPGRQFESDITGNEKRGDFYWPSMPDAATGMHDINSEPWPSEEFLNDFLIRTCELIDKYKIRQLYFDWWIQHSAAKPYLRKIAAYYYNRAEEWGEEVMIAYKHDAFAFGTAVVDMERGKFAEIQHFPWQTDTAVGKWSWGYAKGNQFKEARDIIRELVDTVSKNGCMLLNIGPKPDGTITEEERAVLLEVGGWLRTNGEAVYGTRCWKISAEGPTRTRDGMFTDNDGYDYTSEDFRFTIKGDRIYVVCLSYPEDGKIRIKSLQGGSPYVNLIDVEVLGFEEKPRWSRDGEGLHIETETVRSELPVVFRITTE
ncbi:MAG: alpha-L-fucosidase [Lachnospiraceae bacterium]|nr:alpha-L-fucosidase [Lachnospiraceae bacterium]